MRILAISGSLRAGSSNAALLLAAAELAPSGMTIGLDDGPGALPHFNPDLDDAPIPAVLGFRGRLREADGVLISSPEYAHGVPGMLKNALDWVVGSGELVFKPIALFNASARATHAHASLTETLTVMNTALVPGACITLPLHGRRVDPPKIVADAALAGPIRAALAALALAIESRRAASD